jgi:hypothetical protein
MGANTQPIFILNPWNKDILLSTQTLSRDGGTGTPATLLTAGSNGSLVETVYAIPMGNEPANVIRLFLAGATAGYDLIREVTVPLTSGASNTAAVAVTAFTLPPLIAPASSTGLRIGAGLVLFAALGTAATAGGFRLVAQGGDY